MNHVFPEQRDDFINFAINSENNAGEYGPYQFKIKEKQNQIDDNDDMKKNQVTCALAKTIFQGNPDYKKIAFKFYMNLIERINDNAIIKLYKNDIVVLIKGSNAYKFILSNKFPEDFEWSDMDIVIYINHRLNLELFYEIKIQLTIIVQQIISQYKRSLDNMFCHTSNNKTNTFFLDTNTIDNFKMDYQFSLNNIELPDNYIIHSPFSDLKIRNKSSRYSQLILNSLVKYEHSVIIEIPHFNKCENIPLSKTPIYISSNFAIKFFRDIDNKFIGHFDLHRIRINNLYSYSQEQKNEDKIKDKWIVSDFIDVVIPYHDDAELNDFWNNPNYLCKNYNISLNYNGQNLPLFIPDIFTCIKDLDKMLNLYQCPKSKREKRERKLKILQSFLHQDFK